MFRNRFRLIALLAIVVAGLFWAPRLHAQDAAQIEQMMKMPLPMNPKVKYGKLENGMTYYILANKEPRERAEFYIIHNVGAILENDDQQGLAHFTEHMAFNGTTHFPGKKLLNFLEHNGVKFGADVNAFTAQEVTCYNISDVPTTRKGLLDSCVMVLCDWSGEISFVDKEIDDERGVIMEELRTRRNASWRARDVKNRLLFKGSKYAERDVIGTLDLLQTFKYQTIKDFYHKWYRPDLQAIVVVGDFDADEMEARVKKMASAVRVPKDLTPKPKYEIPVAKGIAYGTYTDPEMQMRSIDIYFRHEPDFDKPKTMEYLYEDLVRAVTYSCLNNRFRELIQSGNAPFVNAQSYYYSIVHPMDIFGLTAVAKPGMIPQAYEALVTEAQRAVQHGFVASELARTVSDYVRTYQSRFDEREKQSNSSLVWSCLNHFTQNEPMLGIELESKIAISMLQGIELSEVNEMIKRMMPSRDLMVFISAPETEKANLPTEAQISETYNKICDSKLEPWVDNVKNEPLIAELPKPGEIVKEKTNKKFGSTEWTLSNGMRVVLKPTDFKDDEVQLYAVCQDGYASLAANDIYSAQLMATLGSMSGLGNFDAIELSKLTAGKMVHTSAGISRFLSAVSGESSAKIEEVELLFQLVYLRFMNPRFDEKAFNTMLDRVNTVYANKEKDPNSIFSRKLALLMNSDNERAEPLSLETLKKVDFERMKAIYKQMFEGAQNFTVYMVGNINLEQLKPLVKQYLASIPKGKEHSWKDDGLHYPEQARTSDFQQDMETPKTRVAMIYGAPAKYTLENQVYVDAIEHVLGLRNTEEIREKEGGTYGVSSSGILSSRPKGFVRMVMVFDTDPEKAAPLIPKVDEIFTNLNQEVKDEDVLKAKLHFQKSHAENIRKNEYWMSVLEEFDETGVDMHTDYDKLVNGLTAKNVQKAFKDIFGKSVHVRQVMRGYKAQ